MKIPRSNTISRRRLFLPIVFLLTSCSTSTGDATDTTSVAQTTTSRVELSDPSPPTIAVTYSVLASLVSELVGELARVVSVIPDGEDPHAYQPTASELQVIRDSDFVVANGLHFEAGLDGVLEEVRRDGKRIFYVIDHVTGRLTSEDADSHNHDGHDHGEVDLHLWLSPPTMRQMIPELSRRLGELLNSDLEPAAERLTNELDALDTKIFESLAPLRNCSILVNHDEFGYFAERYGCISRSVTIPSTTTELTDATIATIREAAQNSGVRTVFTNKLLPPELIEQIASTTGIEVVFVQTHSMGASTGYPQFMQSIVEILVSSLIQ